MLYRGAFVVLLIVFTILGSVNSDSSSNFVKTKEDEVRTIAQAATDNYANSCEFVSTCLSPQNCSRLECYPLPFQNSETTCVDVNDNKWCTNTTGGQCNNVEANFLKGYVRTPPLDFSSVGGTTAQDREIYLGSSICIQRNLDPTFVSVNNTLRSNSSVNYFYNLYFGAVDGSFRYYPGRELLTARCGKYDPRRRPWYIGAISILKDVVILIDTGMAMQQNSNFLDPTTSFLGMTTTMISLFVETLAAGDRVTVLPVNGSGSYYPGQPNYQYTVPGNQALDTTAPDFQGLLAYIHGSTFAGVGAGGNGAPTNFTDGFMKANSTFGSSSPTNAMKIVILITNSQSGNVPRISDVSAANQLNSSELQLFVYDLGPAPSSWGSNACEDGENQGLFSINPLLFLGSYFSFLASARIAANNGQPAPFWQNPYNDASDLGLVITVAYPAMSPGGQLIGVAGIDVQMAGLDSDPVLKSGVEAILTSSADHSISENANAGNIAICQTAYKSDCSGITLGSTSSLCSPSAQPASDEQLTELLCCKDCTRSSSSNHLAIWISVGVLCGLFVLLVLAVIFLLRRSRRRRAAKRRKQLALNEYSYEGLRKATNGFATKNIIGRGAFGVVYKAVLGDETVAVKQLSQPADRAEDFEAEIKILGLTSHPNLVELKGTCFQPTQCFLVYELVDSGDLHSWLWPEEKSSTARPGSDTECWGERFLTWNKRRKIARGVARGLNYLHRGLQPNGTIFHLDIKPHNILLESHNFNPKIADFGISQLYEPGYTFKVASVVRGTFGYIAPEVLHGQVKPNSKLDVYSYGMVLLHLVSGRKIDDPDVKPFLLQWARTHVEDGYVERVVDENLIGTVQEEYREALLANCKQLIILALRCLSDRPELRPEMSDVLEAIDSLRDVVDIVTPLTSEDDRSGPADHEKTADVKLKKPQSTTKRLIPFSGEYDGSFQHLSSGGKDESESMERNPEIASLVSSPAKVAKGPDILENSSRDGSDSVSRSSLDSSFKGTIDMPNMQVEPKSRTLRRSVSS